MKETTGPLSQGAWIADSGFFIACGRQENNKYTALARFARQNGISFVVPQRVYEELGGAPNRSTLRQTPINSAIDGGWVDVANKLDYTTSAVSSVMDDVRGFIARASNRNEDQIEKADAALAGVAIQLLSRGDATYIHLVTTDTDAGNGVVMAVEAHGYTDQIKFINIFEFLNEIIS